MSSVEVGGPICPMAVRRRPGRFPRLFAVVIAQSHKAVQCWRLAYGSSRPQSW
jgi:hypothetical protein